MEAPPTFESRGIDLKIEINKDEVYDLSLKNSFNSLLININKENCFPKLEYFKEFSLKELSQNSKFFKVFDDINTVIEGLKETFENKKPQIEKEKEFIKLIIKPTLLALGESNLIIPIKKPDDKSIIAELCNVVNNQGKEIESLKKNVKYISGKSRKIRTKSK